MEEIKIPRGFLLGAAISAHQTEGNNTNSDWWFYEQQGKLPKSGLACDHYNRFQEDFRMASEIGLNAMRISIEWARVEPEEKVYDIAQIKHYAEVLASMKANGLVRFVTLHHFTLPMWAAKKGGFTNKNVVDSFVAYAGLVVKELGSEIDFCCTINEPEVHSLLAYNYGVHPPFKKNWFLQLKVINNLIRAHNLAFAEIKRINSNLPVGIVKNNVYYEPYRENNFFDNLVCNVASYVGNDYILNRVKKYSDFIGLNYYFTHTLRFSIKGVKVTNNTDPKSDMGWRTFPKGIYKVLVGLKKYNLPVYVTENGIANARDDMRKRFIREHLEWSLKARKEGLDLKGYLYWSLIDNYEWHDGYAPRFGLIEIDYETQKRKVRESAKIIKELQNV